MVIVESPAKAKTINKYLGRDYVVKASRGHVRDLPPHQYGIDPGRNFEPTYEILPKNKKIVDELRRISDKAETVYLATDMDREGEAIAWHLVEALELPARKIKRVVFNEITKSAIKEAFENPHEIDMAKVEAQQARRVLDRIVGYELSPLLWKKIAKGLSAGRVQSVAVRLIVEREREIRAFEPQEYWVIDGVFATEKVGAAQLRDEWTAFLATPGEKGDGPTQRDRFAWLAERKCIEAMLSEFKGETYRPEGKLSKNAQGKYAFESAAEDVRDLAGSLGFASEQVQDDPWKEYGHLNLRKIQFTGRTAGETAPESHVASIDTKRTSTKPPTPFTTATLQQSAANQLHFAAARTMRIAQGLYEGVDIQTGEGNVGLITYMRTDSRNLSAESISAARRYIGEKHGDKYLPEKPNRYASSGKAQEAHEAIRPTDVERTPDSLRGHLSAEQLKLYTLIWNRFVACQMVPAQWDATTVLIGAKTPKGDATFKATGRILVFDGFYKVMGVPKSADDQTLPALTVGQQVFPVEIKPEQKFTSPSARFTEASLVKTLEAEGIGRPSTYAAIIQTIQDRGYVEQEDRKFFPTARGDVVTDKLVAHFPKVMDVRFTSHVEDELDKVEDSQLDWHHVLHEFYEPFRESLARAHDEMEKVKAEPSEYVCDLCGKPMVYRLGKNGRFLSCTGYPECTGTKNVDKHGRLMETPKVDLKCELCGKDMLLRQSKRGPFLGCSGYPDCRNTKPCAEDGTPLRKVRAEDVAQKCEECGGKMEVKFFRGKSFLGCTNYPKCKASAPMPEGVYVEKPKPEDAGARCDKCGRAMVIRKSRRGPFLSCIGFPRCRNAMPLEKLDHLKALEAEGKIPEAPVETAGGGRAVKGAAKGKAKRLTKEEVLALGKPPAGFAWTLTGRPVVEEMPKDSLKCFQCSGEMTLRSGRFGPFFSCGNPKCRAVANLRGDAKKQAEATTGETRSKPIETDIQCPDCGKKMLLRMGRTGRFLGCSGYPECRKTMEPPTGLLRELAETAGV
ncbi:MAG TPA: type I DNA topoisomerase [Phycisphaerae bacterium]|nr:type I DNA topoisomerase [Phycisphaerae bacterium]